MCGCGLEAEIAAELEGSKDPSFLNVSARLNAVPFTPSEVSLTSVALSITGCSQSDALRKTFVPERLAESVNVFKGDSGCVFTIDSFTILNDGRDRIYTSPEPLSTSSQSERAAARFTTEGARSVVADLVTNYKGDFEAPKSLVLVLNFEKSSSSGGIELAHVHTNTEDPGAYASGGAGIGLRVDSMIGRRSLGGEGILALEVRMSCLELRELEFCSGRDLTTMEFRFISSETAPTHQELVDALSDPQKNTAISNDELFANGVFALVSTPNPLPNSNEPATTLWLFARLGNNISAFQLNTSGIAIF